LNEEGKLKKTNWWSPFSGGKRSCLGETVAKPELLFILACLLQRFTVSLPEGAQYDPGYDVASGILFQTPKDFKIVVTPR